MFSELMTDRVTVKTGDGKTFTNVAASVQGNKVFTDRTDIPLRPGDQISRTTPAGVEERFIVEDLGFHRGDGDLPDTYQSRCAPTRPSREGPMTPSRTAARNLSAILTIGRTNLRNALADQSERIRSMLA
jgi:hypothetical protein